MVRIILDEGKDLFEIHLIPDSEGEEKIIEDVYLDMLVSVIDENIEKNRKLRKESFWDILYNKVIEIL